MKTRIRNAIAIGFGIISFIALFAIYVIKPFINDRNKNPMEPVFLPDHHTDFIFTIYIYNWEFIVTIIVVASVLLAWWLLWRSRTNRKQ